MQLIAHILKDYRFIFYFFPPKWQYFTLLFCWFSFLAKLANVNALLNITIGHHMTGIEIPLILLI